MAKVVRVRPGARNNTHDLAFADGTKVYGARLVGGIQSLKEIPAQASTLRLTSGGSEFGSHDPFFSHIQIADFHGGRAVEEYRSGQPQFYDSRNAWTLSGGRLLPGPKAKFGIGQRNADSVEWADMNWEALLGTKRYMSNLFTSTGVTADKAYLWIRRIGNPGTLTLKMHDNSGGDPGTVNQTVTITVADITDIYSALQAFDWSGTETLTGSTDYHVSVFSAATDNGDNHWEIGVNTSTDVSQISSDGSAWTPNPGFTFYYRIVDADIHRKWLPFELAGAQYAATLNADSSVSLLHVNGDRGKATAGSTTTLTDSDSGLVAEISDRSSWDTNQWALAWVWIIAGTGKGQFREIASNTGTVLTVSVAFDTAPDNTSEYIIYYTPHWYDITPSGGDDIDGVVTSVAVSHNLAHFAQGQSVDILRMRFNAGATPPAHEFEDIDGENADIILAMNDPVDGAQLWLADTANATIQRTNTATWTNGLDLHTHIHVGNRTYEITELVEYSRVLFALKGDGVYEVVDDHANKTSFDMQAISHPHNGRGAAAHENFLFIPWANGSLQRMYGGTLDDVGPNLKNGLPHGRRGNVSDIIHHPGGIIVSVDAGAGTSSILVRDDALQGYHEIFSAFEAGQPIDHIWLQGNPGGKIRLWASVGGDLVYMDIPKIGESSLNDPTYEYTAEAVYETSTIYMGAFELSKFFRSLHLTSQNLTAGIEIQLRYQLDDDIGKTGINNWVNVDRFIRSPSHELEINRGNKRQIRLQLILRTNISTTAPVVKAMVLKGFSRVPLVYQYNLKLVTSSIQVDHKGKPDHDPIKFILWLKKKARTADVVRLSASDPIMHNKLVIIEPPTILREYLFNDGKLGAQIPIVLREVEAVDS